MTTARTMGGHRRRGARGRRLLAATAGLALTALLAGCAGPSLDWPGAAPTVPTADPSEEIPLDALPFYQQEVDWTACEDNASFQCATIDAPLNWDDPAAGSIELAMAQQPATGSDPIGSLFFNPGGPGASGIDTLFYSASGYSAEISSAYNLVSFDPRGVSRSTPITCFETDQDFDEYLYGDPDDFEVYPEAGTPAYFERAREEIAELAAGCEDGTGELLAYVDTWQVARDLDMMRYLMGDEKLHYVGYSYGTRIGAYYGAVFPEKVGHLVLDGVIDPSVDPFEDTKQSAIAFDESLGKLAEYCIAEGDCAAGSTKSQVIATLSRLVDEAATDPLVNIDGRLLLDGTLLYSVLMLLYSEDLWPYFNQSISGVIAGDPYLAFALADAYFGRLPDGSYDGNLFEAIGPINCLDQPAMADTEEMIRRAGELESVAPFFGEFFAYGELQCAEWPYKHTDRGLDFTAPGSAPILVVGTTGDTATPYPQAVSVSENLDNGHLLTFEGEQHTVYGQGVACVDAVVDAYLLEDALPAAGERC